MLNYGFCISGNLYDSYSLLLKLDSREVDAQKIVDLDKKKGLKKDNCCIVRLKMDRLNHDLMDYLRLILRDKFCQGKLDRIDEIAGKKLAYERLVIDKYYEVLEYLRKSED
jgi:hypothetical protein